MSRQPTVASHAWGNGQISTRITRRFIISYQGIIFNTYISTNLQFLKSVGFSSKWKDNFSLLWSLNICHCSCSCFPRTMKWQFSRLLWAISKSMKQKQKPKNLLSFFLKFCMRYDYKDTEDKLWTVKSLMQPSLFTPRKQVVFLSLFLSEKRLKVIVHT